MKKNVAIFLIGLVFFLGLTGYALFRELDRESDKITSSISGVIQLAPGIGAGIVKTDLAYVLLYEPQTLQLVATSLIRTFVPPITFQVGQENAFEGVTLQGSYRMLVVTDKNRDFVAPARGEVIGDLSKPIPLGTEAYQYIINRPFRQFPRELLASGEVASDNSASSIQGTISVAPELQSSVEATDRVIVMLFDPNKGRPAAIKIIPHFHAPQKFSIGASDAMPGQQLQGAYSLRILTDKNNQPFQSVEGEIVGRSQELVPLGTQGLQFILDQPYIR